MNFDVGCEGLIWNNGGADNAKIYIQQYQNGPYCSVPLPGFTAGTSNNQVRSNLGNCKTVAFDVGRNNIRFWLYSIEHACVDRIELQFSTPKGRVTFLASANSSYFGYGTNLNENINYSAKYQSSKYKICLYKTKRRTISTPCALLQIDF